MPFLPIKMGGMFLPLPKVSPSLCWVPSPFTCSNFKYSWWRPRVENSISNKYSCEYLHFPLRWENVHNIFLKLKNQSIQQYACHSVMSDSL